MEIGGTFLEISEENIGPGRKGGPPGGSNRPSAGIGARGRRGGIGFAVLRQVARKETVEPVGKGRPRASQLLSQLVRMECHQRWAKQSGWFQEIDWSLRNSAFLPYACLCGTFWKYIAFF